MYHGIGALKKKTHDFFPYFEDEEVNIQEAWEEATPPASLISSSS